ncbi:MAG: hypothetical protein PVI97_12730 [Candidatus Thiodiazotropha sp.]
MNTNSRPGNNTRNALGIQAAVCQTPETLINELSEIDIHRALHKKSSTAKNLARSAPQQHRAEMEKLLNIGLYVQQRFEMIQKLPKQDINGALAIFLYGIWSVNNKGSRIPGKAFAQLIVSTHEVMANWGNFINEYYNSPLGKRQSLYETFAMIGNWLLMIQYHLNGQLDDTTMNNVKIMVHEIITRSLKIYPESIFIDQEGHLALVPLTQESSV